MAVVEQEVTVLIEVGDHPKAVRDGREVVILPIGSSDVRLLLGKGDVNRWVGELLRAVDGTSV